ncbi:PREDICTED: protein EARLY FLOWERING 3-like [Lupinus angustifolius]|nr:PREDICTED: protein EARLY FLOWERING 3-like [Lupinus angustifolius]
MPTQRAESYISHQFNGASQNTSSAQLEQRNKVDEDDFMVPVYVDSRIGQYNDKRLVNFEMEKLTSMSSRNFGCSIEVQKDGGRHRKQLDSPPINIREDASSESEGLPQVSESRELHVKNISTIETIKSLARQAKVIQNQEYQDSPVEATHDAEFHDTRTGSLVQKGSSDDGDDVSKISSTENLSSLKASPDDVVGVLGQKRFWKARRKFVNQQSVFAVQVFELHRLLKVQKLIAGSPDLLLEDGSFMRNSLPKRSTPNLAVNVVVKPQIQNLKRKDDSEKLNHNKMEYSAENVVGKRSCSIPENGCHLSNYTSFSGTPHQTKVAADNRMGSWGFNHSPGHQWLIPVMTPSEGLVYKPYPGPAFQETMCGRGCEPFGPGPPGGTFMNPSYGVPPHIPPGSLAYFHPYGMPVMNQSVSGSADEQVNHLAAQGSRGQNGHSSIEEANFSTHNQSSYNLPAQKNGAISHVKKFQASKKSEIQGSTASSLIEKAHGIRQRQIAEGRNAHSLSHMATLIPEGVLQPLETGKQTRVIKVVPHNRRSATESAARIFQSIQEERKQCDLL